eukprot:767810-Hanusia_phi.AAC.1
MPGLSLLLLLLLLPLLQSRQERLDLNFVLNEMIEVLLPRPPGIQQVAGFCMAKGLVDQAFCNRVDMAGNNPLQQELVVWRRSFDDEKKTANTLSVPQHRQRATYLGGSKGSWLWMSRASVAQTH